MLKQFVMASLLATATLAHANDIQYTYVEGGLYFHSDQEKIGDSYDYENSETTTVFGQLSGSFGFGSVFYLPVSVESSSTTYEYEYCSSYYDGYRYCDSEELSSLTVMLAAGAGLHADIGEHVSLFAEVSLLNADTSYDFDSDDDDYLEDDSDSDHGYQSVLGIRVQPINFIEFNLNARRIDWSDYSEPLYHKNLAVQFNITQHVAVGAKVIVESDELSKFDNKAWGGYFRYSFR